MTGATSGDSLITLAENKEKTANYKSLAGDFSNIVGSFINYNALKSDLKNLGIQASNVELAKQRYIKLKKEICRMFLNLH